jgi:hypothetical protein
MFLAFGLLTLSPHPVSTAKGAIKLNPIRVFPIVQWQWQGQQPQDPLLEEWGGGKWAIVFLFLRF